MKNNNVLIISAFAVAGMVFSGSVTAHATGTATGAASPAVTAPTPTPTEVPPMGNDKKPPFESMMKSDKNGDGIISKEEFMGQAEERFNEIDTNKDGSVTNEELQSHREMMREKFKEKRAEWREKQKMMNIDEKAAIESDKPKK